jgi:glycosyltransferase involved in cell wall biosynthesis
MSSENHVTPTVSVAMITYNHEQYIKQALESIVSQKTNFKIELIIGEDCSTDATRKICEEYVSKYPQTIRLLPGVSNLGVTPNFVRTLRACSGKFVAVCEGDDYWTDSLKLQRQADFLAANEDYVACFHAVKVIDADDNLIRKSKGSFKSKNDFSGDDLIRGKVMSLSSVCFRNIIEEYPEEFLRSPTGDNFLSSLLGNFGKGKFLNEIEPSAYRMHSSGMWSLQNDGRKRMILVLSYFSLWQYYNRIGKKEYALIFYNKIMLEGFYSNPYEDFGPRFLGRLEQNIIKFMRKFFRVIRRVLR